MDENLEPKNIIYLTQARFKLLDILKETRHSNRFTQEIKQIANQIDKLIQQAGA